MKKLKILILFLAVAAFILIPLPAADVYVRLHFSEAGGDNCSLYYTTGDFPNFSQDKCIISDIDYEKNEVTFRLDSSLEGKITGFRLDFPNTQSLIGIENITVSSAGIVQKQYNPCDFFEEKNVIYVNQAEYSLVRPHNRTYIAPNGDDTYFIFSDTLACELNNSYSHFRLTRLGICFFAAGCYFFTKRKIMGKRCM